MPISVRMLLVALVGLPLIHCAPSVDEESARVGQEALATSENADIEDAQAIKSANEAVLRDFGSLTDPGDVAKAGLPEGYEYLDPNHEVPPALLEEAIAFYDKNQTAFPNRDYITVVDLGLRSDHYRFFLIKMADGSVEKYHTTHGRGGDVDDDGWAESFGNVPSSQKSALGCVRTAEVYSGTYKRSIRLDGLSTTNSKIRERAIVFHGWDNVHEANVIQGRSAGCITLDWAVKDGVLDKIKEGSFMYVGASPR